MPRFLVTITDAAGQVEYLIEENIGYEPRNTKVLLTALETWKRHGLQARNNGDGYLDVRVEPCR